LFTPSAQLDLRSATFSSIEELLVNAGIKVLINASQFGAGLSLSSNLAVISGPETAAIHIFKTTAAALDLRNLSGEGIELTV